MARATTKRSKRNPQSNSGNRRRTESVARKGTLKAMTGTRVKKPKQAAKRSATAKSSAKSKRTSRRVGAGAEHKLQHTMYVCRSCVWTEAQRDIDGKRQGVFLIDEMKKRLKKWSYNDKVTMRIVYCLGGCRNPCDVGFRSPGKFFLRFNKLTPDDAQALLDFAEMYYDSETGDVTSDKRPERLKDNLVVRVPPPPKR